MFELREGRLKQVARQLSKYLVVGATNTTISYIVYVVLVVVSLHVSIAAALAWCVGATNGYILNRRWTFRAHDDWRARIRYVAIIGGAALVNAGAVWLLVTRAGVPRFAAYGVAVPPVTLVAFALMRAFAFDRPAHPAPAHTEA
jgi:putative flippase GtrA